MLIVLSPSKTLDYSTPVTLSDFTEPDLLEYSSSLIAVLRKFKEPQLCELMDISPKLAALNAQRYKDFTTPFTQKNARQALLAFKGDVYEGMQLDKYTPTDFAFAQEHLRILSGLYGVLRPLDLMQPYRLEMGTRLKTAKGKDLYAFWGEHITQSLNAALTKEGSGILLNLASEEYSKAVRPGMLEGRILSVMFKERRAGKVQTIGLFAKKARGLMADYIVRRQVDDINLLKYFNESGYRYDNSLSCETEWVFIR